MTKPPEHCGTDTSFDYDAWAAHIIARMESLAPSQIEWEISEALQAAFRAGQASGAVSLRTSR